MPKIEPVIEFERVMNLVRGFGWEMREQKIEDDKIVLVIEKKLELKAIEAPS